MQDYYNRRAVVYEQIYRREDPQWQDELDELSSSMREALSGLDVLEVACGTGYWTERLAHVARSIVASDASEEMLSIAASKRLPANVTLQLADAYKLGALDGSFSGGLANFWFSHIPRSRISEFLAGFHRRLSPGARLFFADNCNVPGVGGELVTPDGSADTFKRRTLDDGSEHLILKNYYSTEELNSIFEPFSTGLNIHVASCYWWLTYQLL